MAKKLTEDEVEKKILQKCEERNYVLLENIIYDGVQKTLLQLRCKNDGYNWVVTYNSFINHNTGCPRCGGKLKLTQEEANRKVLQKCKERNYELIEKFIYENNKTKLHIRCNNDNHEWFVTYNDFINSNNGCSKCGRSLKLTQEEVEKKILQKCKERNYELVENFVYKNNMTRLRLRCKNDGYNWIVTYNSFINQNCGCLKCSGSLKKTQQEAEENISNKCKEKNYELIDKFIYENNKTKIHLKCNKDGYEWKTTYRDFINGDYGCLRCTGFLKKTQDEAEKKVLEKCEERNYSLVENFTYKNAHMKIHLKCNFDNHEWFIKYHDFINGNYGCSMCNESHGEYEISKILKENNIKFIRQKKFENCKNKKSLPFDFYLPEKNILIEYDGKQHFIPIDIFGGIKALKQTQINDNIKTNYAKDNNIKLIRISYKENIKNKLVTENIIL
jgi:very-short-patch-repair endonuclease/ribosomal protein S27AE